MSRVASRSRTRAQAEAADTVNDTINTVATEGGSTDRGSQAANPASSGGIDMAAISAAIAEQVSAAVLRATTQAFAQLQAQTANTTAASTTSDDTSGRSGAERSAVREPRPTSHKPVIARFNGKDPAIQVDSWIRLFEVAFADYNEKEMVQALIRHLDGEAITWFSDEITDKLHQLSWPDITDCMRQRFGDRMTRPIVAAQSRFMNRADTIKGYYDDKMRMLRRIPGLGPLDQVAMLTAGMPIIYKTSLMSARMTTPNDWLELALDLETVYKYKKPPPRGSDPATDGPRPANREPVFAFNATSTKQVDKRGKKKPSKPCKFCLEANVTAFHWHSECDRRPAVNHAEGEEDSEPHTAFTASGNAIRGRGQI